VTTGFQKRSQSISKSSIQAHGRRAVGCSWRCRGTTSLQAPSDADPAEPDGRRRGTLEAGPVCPTLGLARTRRTMDPAGEPKSGCTVPRRGLDGRLRRVYSSGAPRGGEGVKRMDRVATGAARCFRMGGGSRFFYIVQAGRLVRVLSSHVTEHRRCIHFFLICSLFSSRHLDSSEFLPRSVTKQFEFCRGATESSTFWRQTMGCK